MKPTVLYYAKCTTCQKALKWLEERGIAYEGRPIKEENPTADELRDWYEKSACRSSGSSTPAACSTKRCR